MRFRYISAIIGLMALIVGFLPQVAGAQSRPSQSCFTETGYCIGGPIRDYWERNGGLAVFGYPISEQRVETVEGRTLQLQWFERDRLEIQAGGFVTAGRLGARLLELQGRPWFYGPNTPPVRDCVTFAQTGYSLCGLFRSYWERNGGLERFGFPITGVIQETIEGRSYSVQYFERRRMEYHPQNAGTPYEVQLGLLGRDVYTGNVGGGQQIDIELDQARISLYEFFGALNSRDYGTAADLYGGDMSQLAMWNPDIVGDIYGDRKTRAALFQRGCEANGLYCLAVSKTLNEYKIGPQAYRITVEFSWRDGRAFRHPMNGATRFEYEVVYNGARYVVMQLPQFAS